MSRAEIRLHVDQDLHVQTSGYDRWGLY